MKPIRTIINSYKENLDFSNFYGDVYFHNEDSTLDIDDNTRDKLFSIINNQLIKEKSTYLLVPEEELLLAFKTEFLEQGHFLKKDKNYLTASLFDEKGFFLIFSENQKGLLKKTNPSTSSAYYFFEEITRVDDCEEIKEDEFTSETPSFIFHFDDGDSLSIPIDHFGSPKNKITRQYFLSMFSELIDYGKTRFSIMTNIEQLQTESNAYEESINLLEDFKNSYGSSRLNFSKDFYYSRKILALIRLEKNNEAQKLFEEYKQECIDHKFSIDESVEKLFD